MFGFFSHITIEFIYLFICLFIYLFYSSQGNIIACVFTGVNSLRNSQQCPTTTSFVRLEQETVNLIAELQQTCGSGKLHMQMIRYMRGSRRVEL